MPVSSSITPDELFAMSTNVYDAMRGLDSDDEAQRELRNALYRAHEAIHANGVQRKRGAAE